MWFRNIMSSNAQEMTKKRNFAPTQNLTGSDIGEEISDASTTSAEDKDCIVFWVGLLRRGGAGSQSGTTH